MIEIALILVIGMFLIYAAFKANNKKCPEPQVVYRFIPRTLEEEMKDPVKPSEIFKSMFDSPNILMGREVLS